MTTAMLEKTIMDDPDKGITSDEMRSSINVKLFPELVMMINDEMERLVPYILSIFDDGDDICRIVREGLSKAVTKRVMATLLEDPCTANKRSGYYYLLDPYGLLCGMAKVNSDGSLRKSDSMTLRKSTVKGIKRAVKREILERLKKEFNDIILTRSDFNK